MPAPAYRSFVKTEVFTGSGIGGSGTTVTLTKPAGVVSGDVLIAAMNNIGAARSVTSTPTGWTLIKEELVTTAPAVGLWVFKKVAGGSEPASYGFTFNYDFNGSAGIVAYSGGDDVSIVGNVTTTAGGSSPYSVVAPSVTTPDNDSLLVWVGTLNVPTPTAAATFTPPTGYTERFEQSTSYNNAALSMADKAQAVAGASGSATGSAANTSGGTSNALGLLVAIAPTGGSTTIVASGSGEIPEIKAVSLSPSSVTLNAGNVAYATLTLQDQDGAAIAGLSGTITSSNTSAATASQVAATNDEGQAQVQIDAVAVGASLVTATFDDVVSNATVIEVVETQNVGSMVLVPLSPSIEVGQTVQFFGAIDGVNDPSITWSVVSGSGTISASGVYTAPATAGFARVRGTYVTDPTISGDAVVTITVPSTTAEATVSTVWQVGNNFFANQSLDYFVFSANDELIKSGTATTNNFGQLTLTIPALYSTQKVLVVVNNLASTLSTVGTIQGQQVVTAA